MKQFLLITQILTALALCTLILLQSSKGGLGGGLGGGESYHTKRGAERAVFSATIGAAILFLLISILNVVIS